MDYERIRKPFPPGGGLSPGKLRAMLLGLEKRRKEEEDQHDYSSSLRSEPDSDDRLGSTSDDCKDVDMVSSVSDCSSSGHRSRDHVPTSSRARFPEEDSMHAESVSSSAFEFEKAERALQRPAIVPPFSKPAPSKWDDAQKWIASPNTSRASKPGAAQHKKLAAVGHGSRQPATKVVMEVVEEADTKRIDASQVKMEMGGQKTVDVLGESNLVADSCSEAAIIVDKSVAGLAVSLSKHDSSAPLQSSTTFVAPPSTVRSVSMRDMGTEMTPIASQEPSRTGTPTRSTTPMRSPRSSRPSTPQRAEPSSTPIQSADYHGDHNKKELSEKELQMQTRREIMLLGTQLGKTNIAAWASKEEEEMDASISLKTLPMDQPEKNATETRAAAWEEAEKTRYLARFKREEIKIQAWEDHQRAKTEAEIRRIEVDVEKMRARAHDKLMSQLAAARHKAVEKRAAAEARRNQQAARTAEQAEYIRKTGHVPSSFCCWGWCS